MTTAEEGDDVGLSEPEDKSLHQVASRISHRYQVDAGLKDRLPYNASPATNPELDPDNTLFNSGYRARIMLEKVKGLGLALC